MKVYVLEAGCYENEHIVGVYSTPEKAMAAWHPDKDKAGPFSQPARHTYTWGERSEYGWFFSADWDDAARVFEYVVDPT